MIIYQFRIYRQDLKLNPDALFVFGDNMQRRGMGGQAKEMRYEPNALGIATLWEPGRAYSEGDLGVLIEELDDKLPKIVDHMGSWNAVVFPSEGIGTGLAMMPQRLRDVLDDKLLSIGIVNDYFGKMGKNGLAVDAERQP